MWQSVTSDSLMRLSRAAVLITLATSYVFLCYEAQWERIQTRRREHERLKTLDELRETRSETMLMLGLLATTVGFIGLLRAMDHRPRR